MCVLDCKSRLMTLRWLRQTLSRLPALACVAAIVLLTAMPILEVAAAGNCHSPLASILSSQDDHHHHVTGEPPHPKHEGTSPAHAPMSLDCCVTGCCIAPPVRTDGALALRLGVVIHAQVVDRLLPGTMSEGLHRPPRSTDIAVPAA